MIKDNEIFFGYGDIIVGMNKIEGCLILSEHKTPIIKKCIGKPLTDEEKVQLIITNEIRIHEEYFWEIYDELKRVNENNRIISLVDSKTGKKYILNFENYNQESVNAVRECAYNMVNTMLLAF